MAAVLEDGRPRVQRTGTSSRCSLGIYGPYPPPPFEAGFTTAPPAGETAHHFAPKALTPSPFVWPFFTEFHFTLSTQAVHTGTITFKVKNNGGIPHNLRIDNQQTPNIDPGSTVTLKVTFTKPGNYPYLCTIPGHAQAGMKGVLKVT